MSEQAGKAVVVTTGRRGVFFGYVEGDATKTTLELKRARNCVYWSSDVKGFIGLAAGGPTKSCKIGPAAPSMIVHEVTSVIEASEEAVQAWEKGPWAK